MVKLLLRACVVLSLMIIHTMDYLHGMFSANI